MRDAYDSICLSLEIANDFRHVMLLAPTSHSAGWLFSAISFQGYQKLADPPTPNFNHFVSCPQFLIARKKKKTINLLFFPAYLPPRACGGLDGFMVLARAKQACHEGEVGEVDSTAADKALALIEGAAGELDYLLDNADADPEKKVRKNMEKQGGR